MLIGCSCNDTSKSDTAKAVKSNITWTECGQNLGDHPCNLSLLDSEGETWNLYDHYGKIIVLDFSAAWCYYCQVAANDAGLVESHYGEDILYVTVLIENFSGEVATPELAKDWKNQFGISGPVLAGSRDLIDSDPDLGWPIQGWPTFWFVDEEMVIRHEMKGYSNSMLLTTIDSMIVEQLQKNQSN